MSPTPHSPAPQPDADPELARLLRAVFDDEIGGDDAANLERQLLASRSARDEYRRWMRMEALLECGLTGGGQMESRPTDGGRSFLWRAAGSVLAACAAGAAALAIVAGFMLVARPSRPPEIAAVTAAVDCECRDPQTGVHQEMTVGTSLAAGPLRLATGAVQLTFASGAVVAVNAPADLELVSATRVMLRRGRVVPLVPERAKGFTVALPSGEVVDLGTEFAVTVDDRGQADVQVLDGEVALVETQGRATPPTHLKVGYEARMTSGDAAVHARVTAMPLFFDAFTAPDGGTISRDVATRQSGLLAPIRFQSLNHDAPARLHRGRLQIPFFAPVGRTKAVSRVVLDRDFSDLAGRRWSLAFKAWLPPGSEVPLSHHLDCVIGAAPSTVEMPFVWDDATSIGLLVQHDCVGIDFNGPLEPPPQPGLRVFPRTTAGSGPFQVLIQVDETGPGDARVDVLVNGRDLLRDFRVSMPKEGCRVIGFHTWTKVNSGANGYGEIDDLCITIDSPDPIAAAAPVEDDAS